MPIEILPTDKEFITSPDSGDPECLCSRCMVQIKEFEIPLRCWPEDKNTEYRYCEQCQESMGIVHGDRVTDEFWPEDENADREKN